MRYVKSCSTTIYVMGVKHSSIVPKIISETTMNQISPILFRSSLSLLFLDFLSTFANIHLSDDISFGVGEIDKTVASTSSDARIISG